MKMRALRWNLATWDPSAGPADPFGAPRLTHIAWAIRARWQLIFLISGLLLMGTGMVALHSTVAFIAGVLLVGVSAPVAGPHSPTTAMVRTWQWLNRRQAD
jgi:hypothetical protein